MPPGDRDIGSSRPGQGRISDLLRKHIFTTSTLEIVEIGIGMEIPIFSTIALPHGLVVCVHNAAEVPEHDNCISPNTGKYTRYT